MAKSKIKIKKQCSGNEVFSNEGLLMEILLRLPVKSLVRFKCVSKQWSFLISSPYFTRLRIPCFNSPRRGLFLHNSLLSSDPFTNLFTSACRKIKFQKLCFVHDPYGIRIRQSCNGFLLCCSYRAGVCEKNYYIYNPTTRQFITLAKPVAAVGGGEEEGEIPMVVLGMTLAFDPRKSPHYKVICVRILSELAHEQQQQQIEIYSSETKKWRVSGPPFPARRDINFTFDGVYWNGGIYWPCGDNSLCFNIEEEKFKKFTMPCNVRRSWEEDDGESRIAYYGECCGHLNLVQVQNRQKLSFYNIYEMKSDGTLDWFLKYQVNVEGVIAAFPRTIRRRYLEPTDWHYYAMAVLCVVTGEEVEDAFLVLYIPKMVIRFNLKDYIFYKLYQFGNTDYGGWYVPFFMEFEWWTTFQYIYFEFSSFIPIIM